MPPKPAPDGGYPRNAAHTVEISESTRGYIKQLKSFICEAVSLTYGERLWNIPTTTTPKRLPGRAFIDKSRPISDLRRIKLGIDAGDFSPIWLPALKHITDRIIRKKPQYPGVPIKSCKMDNVNAFNRVPLRPGYIAIFCHQCGAIASGMTQYATIGWLAPPFGFDASPEIFAMRTEVIHQVHRIAQSRDGSRPGWGRSDRESLLTTQSSSKRMSETY